MKISFRLCTLVFAFILWGCSVNVPKQASDNSQIEGHPAWIMNGNIYEVNIRQYTEEGTFRAFSSRLSRLKFMGVQTLWFMPIHPISKTDRKGEMGSYYAVADYTAVNPDYGTLDDWKHLVSEAHKMGFKVIIDWVPNHTGADHRWLTTNPDFYLKNAEGKPTHPLNTDWTDIRKLEYTGPQAQQLADSMIAAMKYWIAETDIDGYRVDVAGELPKSFYQRAIPELRKMKNIFMLAEADQPWLHEVGFDATYGWDAFHMMKRIAAGERKASALDTPVVINDRKFPPNSLRMYFTSNHDENSWNKADYATMPGAVHAPFAVLTQTLAKSVPLIYSGQEEPVTDSISFFYKDPIVFGRYLRADFYRTLLGLRSRNAALAANASFTRIGTGSDDQVYAFTRQNGADKILVLTNLSDKPARFTINNESISGHAKEVFTAKAKDFTATATFELPAWGYQVYEYK
ncbi:MAG TPA: alpha-amylase family glycosyl hydrolase [Chitinophagaceae bacterium]